MELLTIEHEDFTLTIENSKFPDIWRKAENNIGEQALLSSYSWTEGVLAVTLTDADGNKQQIEKGKQARAIFFDNADYPIWVDFNKKVEKAQFGSMLQSDNDSFSFRHNILAGFMNYGNEIGRSELNIIYKVDTEERRFTFTFEVLSTKLDYHEHWQAIVNDIEAEYRMLSLDYMRRTFHGFSPDTKGDKPEIVWWSVFAGEQRKFIKACKNIIERPHHKLRGHTTYKRADKLTLVPATIENELAEHRHETAHLYRVEEQLQTNDTQENRFLKFAIGQIADRYEKLRQQIEQIKNASDTMRGDMRRTADTLKRLRRHPFFRTVGRYKGMSQESLVLQQATGYSQVYRTWNLLRRSYSLNDGMYRLQTKDIATLYEIWCFIEVSHIVKEQLHLTDEDVDHRNRMELNGVFTWELGKGEHSRILFKKDGVELAELIYNPKSKDTEIDDDSIGLKDLEAPTVPQKPDIVLQLTKNDLREGMKMTYLFDAKYRIDGKKKGVDVPPEDAINQMHRYRDAIYYRDYQANALKKEVIGGYILFPGEGNLADWKLSDFYETIGKVNIGAFPLRPTKDNHSRQLLEEFIQRLIEEKSQETVANVIPQKGTYVDVGNRVLIGLVRNSSRKGYMEGFEDGNATLYYTGSKFPTTIPLQNLHFFMPMIKGKGVRDVYEIVRIRTITAKDAKQLDDSDPQGDDLRLAFELHFSRRQYDDYVKVKNKFADYTFINTTFDELKDSLICNQTEDLSLSNGDKIES